MAYPRFILGISREEGQALLALTHKKENIVLGTVHFAALAFSSISHTG
jgi:hypothetical protein